MVQLYPLVFPGLTHECQTSRGTNTLAYFAHRQCRKSFITSTPDGARGFHVAEFLPEG
jgi:hypothetical protein